MANKILFGRHQWCSARPYPTGLRFCALRTVLMRLGLLRYLTSSSALHHRLQAVGMYNWGRSASLDAVSLDLRFAWICVGGVLCEKLD